MADLAWWLKRPTTVPSRAGLAAHAENRGGQLSWRRGGGASGRTRVAGEAGFGGGRRVWRWRRPEGGSPAGGARSVRPWGDDSAAPTVGRSDGDLAGELGVDRCTGRRPSAASAW
jgi:hypothetical protein